MTLVELGLALTVLLLTPGPTNTLMLMAGAERGLARALWLIPVELAAYLAVVLPLALLAEGLAAQMGILRPVVGCWRGFGCCIWPGPCGARSAASALPRR